MSLSESTESVEKLVETLLNGGPKLSRHNYFERFALCDSSATKACDLRDGNFSWSASRPCRRGTFPGRSDSGGEGIDHGIDVRRRIISAEAETKRSVDARVVETERAQHVRALAAGLGARGAGRQGEAIAEREQQRFRLDALDRHVEVARKTRRERAVDRNASDLRVTARASSASRKAPILSASPAASARCASRAASPKPTIAGHVVRSGAQPLLLAAALGLRLQPERAAGGPCARRARRRPSARTSCGPTGSSGRRSRRSRRPGCGRGPAPRPNERRSRARDTARRSRPRAGSCRSRCWRPSRKRARCRAGGPRRCRPTRTRPSGADGDARDLEALALERPAGLEDRRVLERRRHDVAAGGRQRARQAANRQVVGLGRPRGEDDLVGRRPDQRGDLLPGLFDRPVARPGPGRGAGWTGCRSARVKNGSIASRTAGSTGVVAWWSR